MICWFGEVEVCVKKASSNGPFDLVEVLVPHQDHRALAQRRHRLVGRVGLVDADAHLVRVRQQVHVEQLRVLRIELAGLRRERLVLVAIGGVAVARGQRGGGAHGRAPAVERVEAREAEPGLVPEEDQVRLDRQALLHHPPRVVHVAVEGAVGHVDHLHAVELALGLAVEQRLLDRAQRHARRTSSTAVSG